MPYFFLATAMLGAVKGWNHKPVHRHAGPIGSADLENKDKLLLSASDICDHFITPEIRAANWDPLAQIRREVTLAPGPVIVHEAIVARAGG
ncbi:hypothetical protein QM467_01540 [Rhodoblastus sp. 17X3]|uniref:hypothetical protein n=1 Tax=Rhodoblastus sp. 17X3 TaxID=3047026 RepID=UPI0024B7E18F|nr:hypothetical protein [Rhodoblastus sp. 17X3]MDI9846737.1 hypothetical protein [Rhodoblastus sp. 17X3]